MSLLDEIPKAGYCRLRQILGDKNAKPRPIHAGRCAMWRWEDIRRLVERMEGAESGA